MSGDRTFRTRGPTSSESEGTFSFGLFSKELTEAPAPFDFKMSVQGVLYNAQGPGYASLTPVGLHH